jgi:uncharacterized membrane protein HdeD (DUF308 family)
MLNLLARNWWLVEIRGVSAIAFGILAFLWPNLTLVVLITLFAAFVLIDGIALLVSVARGESATRGHRWSVALMGILGVGVGIATIILPGITALALLYLAAFWAITLGISQVVVALRLRREIAGELWLVIGGLVTALFGVFLLVFPGAGLLSLVWIVGAWAIIFGFTNLILAWRLRGLHHDILRSRIVTSAR